MEYRKNTETGQVIKGSNLGLNPKLPWVESNEDEYNKYCCQKEYCEWNGSEWIVDLDKYKEIKVSELKSIKNEKIATCKVGDDLYFQTDDSSLNAIESRTAYLLSIDDTAYNLKTYLHSWRCSDNSILHFASRDGALEVLNNTHDLARKNWGKYNELSDEILSCTTCEELCAVDIETGWVEMDITL